MSGWNEARDAMLRRLWGLGWTASKIAGELRVSRNAVIGRKNRLKIGSRPSPIKTADPAATEGKRQASRLRSHGKNRQQQRHAMQAAIAKSDRTASQRIANLNGHTVVQPVTKPIPAPAPRLSRDACAWPIGDPKKPDFRWCGAKPVVPGKPYCAHHCSIAYRSPEEAARERAGGTAAREAA
jgi:GcrA cell cycle regulator